MKENNPPLPWTQAGWFEEASEWILEQLALAGRHNPGPVKLLHQRPWATFARVSTDEGIVYFKAPANLYEAPVTQSLAQWRPDCTVDLLAVNLEQGWLLSADSGVTFREADPTAGQVEHWVKLMPFYAEIQRQMAKRLPELLDMGMVDYRLETLPGLYNKLVESSPWLRVGLEPGLSREEHGRLLELRSDVAGMCVELASYGFDETLTHEELHDANVLVNGSGDYIFTDWSDACVGHPFFSLMIAIRAAAYRLKLAEDGPEMDRIRDAFLESWTEFDTRERLESAMGLAQKLAMMTRALSWERGAEHKVGDGEDDYSDYVPEWLRDFLGAVEQDS